MWAVLDRRKSQDFIMTRLLALFLVSLLHMPGSSGAGRPMKTSYACQGDRLELQCPQGSVIKVMRANYGRFSVGICNQHGITDWSVNCMAPRSLRILQDRCNNQQYCDISAENNNFGGDPCPNIPKYLEVYFGCFDVILEGSWQLNFLCRCDEKADCSLNASLDIRLERDPCPGTEKYLEAHYVCHSLSEGPPTQETTTSSTTTPNPLPPWLTTRSPLSFLPGLYDFDIKITPPPARIPVTAPDSTTTRTTTTTTTTTTTVTTTTTTPTTTTRVSRPSVKAVTEQVDPAVERVEEKQSEYYTSERRDDSEVMIVKMPPPTPAAPHVGPMSPLRLCPPRNIRALRWSWTVPGGVARQACPPGTTGEASWTCGLTVDPGTGASSPAWSPASPDLSQCQSVWMEKIISELRTSDLIINLANDLMQYVSVNALYGKDITSAIDAMTIIAEKMQYQLREIPTREQREAMVMELVQSLTKIASFLLADKNLPAWQDLPAAQQTRFLTNFISALERTGSLLPGVVEADQEVSMSSDNLLLTIRKISFRNIRGTQFPSRASLATDIWQNYTDTIQIPAVVLMENMNREAAQVVFLSMRNMEKLLLPGSDSSERVGSEIGGDRQIVNSQVIHIAFGERSDLLTMTKPVSMMFRHSSLELPANSPTCVLWDAASEAWSPRHCQAVFTNSSHTQCHCSRVGTFALLETMVETDSLARTTFVVIIIVAVSVSTVVLLSLVLAVIYCYRIKVRKQLKIKLNKADLTCFKNKNKCWSLTESPTLNEDLFPADNSDSAYDIVRNSDFMVLSRAALAVHDCSGLPEFSRTLDCSVPGPQVRTRPRQLELGGALASFPRHQGELGEQPGSHSSHIYMEVDPLYSIMAEPGVVSSSSSSQTSSGYSTAPSNTNNLYEVRGEGGDYPGAPVVMFQHLPSHTTHPGHIVNTKENSRASSHGLRTSQRKARPELIMNNILLQQANRQVL